MLHDYTLDLLPLCYLHFSCLKTAFAYYIHDTEVKLQHHTCITRIALWKEHNANLNSIKQHQVSHEHFPSLPPPPPHPHTHTFFFPSTSLHYSQGHQWKWIPPDPDLHQNVIGSDPYCSLPSSSCCCCCCKMLLINRQTTADENMPSLVQVITQQA